MAVCVNLGGVGVGVRGFYLTDPAVIIPVASLLSPPSPFSYTRFIAVTSTPLLTHLHLLKYFTHPHPSDTLTQSLPPPSLPFPFITTWTRAPQVRGGETSGLFCEEVAVGTAPLAQPQCLCWCPQQPFPPTPTTPASQPRAPALLCPWTLPSPTQENLSRVCRQKD